VAARELAERRGVAGFRQRKFRGEDELAHFERGGVQALEEVFCGNAPLAFLAGDDEDRPESDRTGRELRRGVCERAAPAESAAIADGRVRDMRHRCCDKRKM